MTTIAKKLNFKELGIFLLFMLVAAVINWKLIRDGPLYNSDDIWWHLDWLKEFSDEIKEGFLYPRWLANSNFGYGSPTFVFYPPLIYYVGALIRFTCGVTIEQVSTAVFWLATAIGATTSYLFCKDQWGRAGGIIGAVAYVSAPYFVYDIYMRGALGETWALSWLPLIFLCTRKACDSWGWRLLLSVSFTLLCLTHILGVVITCTVWAAYIIFLAVKRENKRGTTFALIGCLILGFLTAGFFLVPVALEVHLVTISALTKYIPWTINLGNYGKHMNTSLLPPVTYYTLFSTIVLGVIAYFLKPKNDEARRDLIFWCGAALVTVGLMTPMAEPLWNGVPFLQTIQFPSRWLIITTLAMSNSFAAIVSTVWESKRVSKIVRGALFILVVCLLLNNMATSSFMSRFRSGLTNPTAYIWDGMPVQLVELGITTMPKLLYGDKGYPGVEEYRPLIFKDGKSERGPKPKVEQPPYWILAGEANISCDLLKCQERHYTIVAKTPSTVKFRTYYYPAWRLAIDGVSAPMKQGDDGLIIFNVAEGEHKVVLKYVFTPAFILGICVSVLGLAVLAFLFLTRVKHVRLPLRSPAPS